MLNTWIFFLDDQSTLILIDDKSVFFTWIFKWILIKKKLKYNNIQTSWSNRPIFFLPIFCLFVNNRGQFRLIFFLKERLQIYQSSLVYVFLFTWFYQNNLIDLNFFASIITLIIQREREKKLFYWKFYFIFHSVCLFSSLNFFFFTKKFFFCNLKLNQCFIYNYYILHLEK